MYKEDRKKTEWLFRLFGLAGVIIWSLTVLLRPVLTARPPLFDFCMGVAPNFGVVFVLAYLAVFSYHRLTKKEFPVRYTPLLCLIIMGILLASEVVHYLFLDAGFDWWDMLASVAACGALLMASSRSSR